LLYALDPLTGNVAEPSNAVGFVDLLDESTTSPAVNKLHVTVQGGTPASPNVTYADYTVSGSVTGNPATAFNASSVGFVSDGTHPLRFSATFAATSRTTNSPDAQSDFTSDQPKQVIRVERRESLTRPDTHYCSVPIE